LRPAEAALAWPAAELAAVYLAAARNFCPDCSPAVVESVFGSVAPVAVVSASAVHPDRRSEADLLPARLAVGAPVFPKVAPVAVASAVAFHPDKAKVGPNLVAALPAAEAPVSPKVAPVAVASASAAHPNKAMADSDEPAPTALSPDSAFLPVEREPGQALADHPDKAMAGSNSVAVLPALGVLVFLACFPVQRAQARR